MDLNTDLTDVQMKALEENADDLEKLQPQLDEVHEKVLHRLERAGLGDGTDILNCLACIACEGWTRGSNGRCGSCSHGWFSHNVI
ncbi:hypothetical protein [Streptomyces sp. AC555_RSS877]|uniref:hypothetical protein n=1 Tax=Streptomyces sp. AC555_RSS877 TaxID=2823688 RepID=UPI001C270086|nr:hypothetical protein [Streptomyces sp. AC555_RSS877]